MQFITTPEDRFENLQDFPFAPKYHDVEGMIMHYVDEGEGPLVLMLHGEPSWSYLYRYMIKGLVAKGYRAVAPDLIGFGKSDKPIDAESYTYENHEKWLTSFLESLDLTNITLFCQDWGGLLGLRLVAYYPDRFDRVCASNTFLPTGNEPFPDAFMQWREFAEKSPDFIIGKVLQKGTFSELSEEVIRAYNAPFPSEAYKMGSRMFPKLVPTDPQHPDGIENQHVWQKLATYDKPFMTAFGADDPITRGARKIFPQIIPGCAGQTHVLLENAGHFIQEDQPERLVELLDEFIKGVLPQF